jgi:hypothetical protein
MSLVGRSHGRSDTVILRLLNGWRAGRHVHVSLRGSTVNAGLVPERLRNSDGVEVHRHPPYRLIAPPMEGAMMGTAQWDRKLVADPTPQGARLHEPQVMWVRWGWRVPGAMGIWLWRTEADRHDHGDRRGNGCCKQGNEARMTDAA